jgi:hypothetical protein
MKWVVSLLEFVWRTSAFVALTLLTPASVRVITVSYSGTTAVQV